MLLSSCNKFAAQNCRSSFQWSQLKSVTRSVSSAFQNELKELNFVDGKRSGPADIQSCETAQVIEPRSGKSAGEFHLSGDAEVNRAVESAKQGLEAWRKASDFEKSRVMQKAASLLRERKDQIAQLDSIDSGQ